VDAQTSRGGPFPWWFRDCRVVLLLLLSSGRDAKSLSSGRKGKVGKGTRTIRRGETAKPSTLEPRGRSPRVRKRSEEGGARVVLCVTSVALRSWKWRGNKTRLRPAF